jgi:purine-binding chemotaxis protein CheW
MTSKGEGYLLVRAGGRRVGLALAQVVEVLDPGPTYPVPAVEPAVRGVTSVRGRILPLIHLGALLEGTGCPESRGEVAIVVQVGGRTLCLEVEEAETVLNEPGLPVPSGTALAWAVAVARTDDGLIPLLDLTALGGRIKEDPAA